MVSNSDVHARVGAYVLDALPRDERQEFEAHLRVCAACRDETRGLTETAAVLGSAAHEAPPARLRERVLRQIGHTRQLPPPVPTRLPRRSQWWSRGMAVAAAACLILALVLGGFAFRTQQRVEHLEAQQRKIESVLSAPDAHVASSQRTAYGTGTVVTSRQRDRAVFTLREGRQLPPTKTYQLWFITGDGAARSAGLLPTEDEQSSRSVVAGSLGDAKNFGVTVEPAGGSPQPTTKPVMLIQLT